MPVLTMKDIAKEVGVSRTAVSFVLNGRARAMGISRSVERKVQDAADRLGYRPSLLARSLTQKRTMTVGLVLPNMTATYSPPMAEAVEREAQRHGYQVILCHHGNEPRDFSRILNTIVGWRVDGLIVVPLIEMEKLPVYRELLELSMPCVLLEREIADRRLPIVTSDVALATQMAVAELVNQGHRRIAFLDAPIQLIESQHREQGYRQALRAAGLSFDDRLVYTAKMQQSIDDASVNAVAQWFASPASPTAAVVSSAGRAVSLYQHCLGREIRVPQDLSMIVMTGYNFTDFHRLRFATVKLDYEEMGRAAFNLLLGEIERERTSPTRVLIAPTWQPGESVMPLTCEESTA